MKKISIFLFLFLFEYICADEHVAEVSVADLIVENCSGCHNLNNNKSTIIPSIKNLSKIEFIQIMKKYKNENVNNVMNRISKVLTDQDIVEISDIIYNER